MHSFTCHPSPSPTMATSIIQGPWLPPPASVYQKAAETHTDDDKAAGTSEPDDANAKRDPQSSAHPQAGDQQQRQYYRRLIRRRYMDLEEAADDSDLQGNDIPDSVWQLKLYGPDIKVITTMGIPSGWILVDRKNSPSLMFFVFLIHRPRSSGKDEEEVGSF
jgi:hypothetical protein